jgi:hypothetical protein
MTKILNSKYLEQVSALIDIIPLITNDYKFAIKGGTAINLFLFDMPRLSVDIDLCYLPLTPREEALRDIRQFIKNLSQKVNILGLKTRENQNVVGYESTLFIRSKTIEVKLEINLVVRGSVYKPISRSLVPAAKRIFKRDIDMLCLDTNDLFAGKICAALDRQHPRDFFDLFMYFKQFSYTRELHHAFIVYLLSCKRPISELINPNLLDIKSIYETQFEGMTSTDISCHTLEETRLKLFEIISSSFTDQEKEFLISFKSGDPKWNLLSIENTQHFPSVKWKLHNIQAMNPIKRKQALTLLEKKLAK